MYSLAALNASRRDLQELSTSESVLEKLLTDEKRSKWISHHFGHIPSPTGSVLESTLVSEVHLRAVLPSCNEDTLLYLMLCGAAAEGQDTVRPFRNSHQRDLTTCYALFTALQDPTEAPLKPCMCCKLARSGANSEYMTAVSLIVASHMRGLRGMTPSGFILRLTEELLVQRLHLQWQSTESSLSALMEGLDSVSIPYLLPFQSETPLLPAQLRTVPGVNAAHLLGPCEYKPYMRIEDYTCSVGGRAYSTILSAVAAEVQDENYCPRGSRVVYIPQSTLLHVVVTHRADDMNLRMMSECAHATMKHTAVVRIVVERDTQRARCVAVCGHTNPAPADTHQVMVIFELSSMYDAGK